MGFVMSEFSVEGVKDFISLVPAILVLLIALAGIFAFFFSKLITPSWPPIFQDRQALILVAVSLMALDLGMERLIFLDGIDGKIDNLSSQLNRVVTAQHLPNKKMAYDVGLDAQRSAKKIIRLTSSGSKSTKAYREEQARLLRGGGSSGAGPIELRILIHKLTPERKCRLSKKIKELQKEGVDHMVTVRSTNEFSRGFDVLIVDNRHAVFGFPENVKNPSFSQGLYLPENSEFVSGLVEWFDNYLWEEAKEVNFDKILAETNNCLD